MLCEANMKLRHFFLIVGALAVTAVGAPKADAFTMDNTSGVNSDGSVKYADPDSQFSGSNSSNGSTTTHQFGNTTIQFGTHNGGLSNSNDDRDRMFLQPNQPGSTFDSR
jgi:hypothetical protein